MKKEFKTAVDSFFVIWPIFILTVQTFFYMTSLQYLSTVTVLILGLLTLSITVLLLAVATTKYIITTESVLIKNLLYSKVIKLSDITEWESCESGISIFAASTKQIELVVEQRKLRISPAKREEFIEWLKVYQKLITV